MTIDGTPWPFAVVLLALSSIGFAAALYILGQVLSIPYQNKTDRLWKLGEDEEEPNAS